MPARQAPPRPVALVGAEKEASVLRTRQPRFHISAILSQIVTKRGAADASAGRSATPIDIMQKRSK